MIPPGHAPAGFAPTPRGLVENIPAQKAASRVRERMKREDRFRLGMGRLGRGFGLGGSDPPRAESEAQFARGEPTRENYTRCGYKQSTLNL
ncbi:MAG: hypothetical protein L6Q45_05105 [Anaerolineales bacterium]|nr:hypothetical protein [Anaerolineales bacterium]